MTLDRRFNILFKLLVVAIVLSPFNYNIYSIRPLDIVLVVFIAVALPIIDIKSANLKSVLLFFLVFVVSIVAGLLFSENETQIIKGIFIYKYTLPFLLIGVLYSMTFDAKQLDVLVKLLFWTYLFLVFWVFFDMIDHAFSILKEYTYIAHRPAFPFRDNSIKKLSDAHLYSTYLSIGLIFFLGIYDKLNISNSYKIPFVVVSLIAIALTGSKTGVLILLLGSIFLVFRIGKKYIGYISVGLVSSLLLFYTLNKLGMVSAKLRFVLARIIDLSFLDHISHYSRVVKTGIGIEDTAIFHHLIGIGIFKSSRTWYDSLIGILFSHVGLIGFLLFMYLLIKLVMNNREYCDKHTKRYNTLFIVVLVCYVVANFITEFFLISRSVFPVILYLSILYHYQKLEYNTLGLK